MRVFADYERQVLRLLAEEHLGLRVLSSVLADGEIVGVDHTSAGCFLSVRHPELPAERMVLSSPTVTGTYEEVNLGFVVLIEDGELTLECHSWRDQSVPNDLRQKSIKIPTRA